MRKVRLAYSVLTNTLRITHSLPLFLLAGLSQLSQGGVPMGSFGQSLGQLNQGGSLGGGLNAGLNIATSMASNGSTVYQAHYAGLNTLGRLGYVRCYCQRRDKWHCVRCVGR